MTKPNPNSEMARGRLSPDEIAQIGTLAENGLKPAVIARRLNRHPGTVSYAMHRLGARTLTKRTFEYMRGGVLVKSFSPEEDEFLTALRVDGLPTTKIAVLLTERFGHRRSPHTILMRLVCLSNQEEA